MEDQTAHYTSATELAALAERFESCALQPDEFPHRAHVALSAWYLLRLPEAEAVARIYDGLRRFVACYQLTVYHETITWFWIKLMCSYVARIDGSRPALEIVNDAVRRFGDSRIIYDYYTRERLQSDDAKTGWVEPDVQPLDFQATA